MRRFLASILGPRVPALPCPALASVPALRPSRQPVAIIEGIDREGRTLSVRSVPLVDLANEKTDIPPALAFAILASLADGPTFHIVDRADSSRGFRVSIA